MSNHDESSKARSSIIAEARQQVEQQQAYFREKAESQWATERGQFRTTAALLEISRIDDETLSPEQLANARNFRELAVDQTSHKAKGSSYDDSGLPERLMNAPEIDQATRDRVTYFTGGQKRRGIKNSSNIMTSTHTLEASERQSPSSKQSSKQRTNGVYKTVITKRPSESYWHHLEDEDEKKKKTQEVEDDPTRDPFTLITELKKQLKHAIDANAICLRVGRQYLRLVYGTSKTAAEVASDTTITKGNTNTNHNTGGGGGGGKVGSKKGGGISKKQPAKISKSSRETISQKLQTPTKQTVDQNKGRLTPRSPDSSLNINDDALPNNIDPLDGHLNDDETSQEGDAIQVLTETFSAKQQRERREQLKVIELERAEEARRYLSFAMQSTDPEGVVDRRVTAQDVAAEERKLRAMAAHEKELFLKQKQWNRAKAIVDERQVQRLRIRSAAHELWLLELHMQKPVAARDAMVFWLETVAGENERLAALQALHESLAAHEKLVGDYYSANTHALHGSLGELGDLHLSVLAQLRAAFPYEQHYLYALGRLQSKRLGRYHDRQYFEAFVDANMSEKLDKRKETKSNGYYHRRAAELGERAISRLPKQDALSHWQVDVREERLALQHRDDFIRGAMPSNAHLNSTHQSASTTIHSLPQGGWNGRINANDGSSEVGFRMEDTLKAIAQRDKSSQYLLEPTVMAGHQLKTRNPITATSSATQAHLSSLQISNPNPSEDVSKMPSDQQSLVQFQPSSHYRRQGGSHGLQTTGQSHPRILQQGVPTGLTQAMGNDCTVVFSAMDGSAQQSMVAKRLAELGQATDVMAQPRRLNPMSCDFDVKNLYSTTS